MATTWETALLTTAAGYSERTAVTPKMQRARTEIRAELRKHNHPEAKTAPDQEAKARMLPKLDPV